VAKQQAEEDGDENGRRDVEEENESEATPSGGGGDGRSDVEFDADEALGTKLAVVVQTLFLLQRREC
jgi:hypothetical protein